MLKNRRKTLGISQKRLAKRLGVNQGYMSKLENRKFCNIKVNEIKILSKELKLDPIEVFMFFYDGI